MFRIYSGDVWRRRRLLRSEHLNRATHAFDHLQRGNEYVARIRSDGSADRLSLYPSPILLPPFDPVPPLATRLPISSRRVPYI